MTLMQRQSEFTLKEAEAILDDVEKYKELISTEPPLHPKGGDVFLYTSSQSDKPNMDFRFDQMMWKQKGSNYHNIRKYGGRVLKHYHKMVNVKKAPPRNSGSAFTLLLMREKNPI